MNGVQHLLLLDLFDGGFSLPSFGLTAALVVLAILFLVFNRNGGLEDGSAGGGRTGRGQMHRCARCGRDYQPEQVELLAGGNTRVFYDESCPGCGWELGWGSPEKQRPGGASGRW